MTIAVITGCGRFLVGEKVGITIIIDIPRVTLLHKSGGNSTLLD
jgi:hypothetical protein